MTIFSARNLNETVIFKGSDLVHEPNLAPIIVDSTPINNSGTSDSKKLNGLQVSVVKRAPLEELCAWGNEPIIGNSEVSYGIRTDEAGQICTITVPRTRLHTGNVIRILVSFVNCTQGCERVRAALIQQEKRLLDGVMLKVINDSNATS